MRSLAWQSASVSSVLLSAELGRRYCSAGQDRDGAATGRRDLTPLWALFASPCGTFAGFARWAHCIGSLGRTGRTSGECFMGQSGAKLTSKLTSMSIEELWQLHENVSEALATKLLDEK